MGNLNLDKYKDIILVLHTIGEDTAEYSWEYKRPIILLLGHSDNSFTFAVRNDNILFEYDGSNPFGESYEGIEIIIEQNNIRHDTALFGNNIFNDSK